MTVLPDGQVYSDRELVRVGGAGDRQAFAANYDRHADRLKTCPVLRDQPLISPRAHARSKE
jgi:hypothetical protein